MNGFYFALGVIAGWISGAAALFYLARIDKKDEAIADLERHQALETERAAELGLHLGRKEK